MAIKLIFKVIATAAVANMFAFSVAVAQAPQPDPGQILKQEIERVAPAPRRQVETDAKKKPAPKEDIKADNGIKVLVKGFVYKGFTVFTEAELNQVTGPFVGKTVLFSDLRNLALQIQEMYRTKGFSRAQVILPAQDITNGLITFQALEGRLDKSENGIKVTPIGKQRIKPEIVKRVIQDTLQFSPAIDDDSLERATLLLNDMPGSNAAVSLAPGSVPGETQVVVSMREVPPVQGSVSLDDSGNRYTGRVRAGLNMYVNSPLQIGDQLSFSGLRALNGEFDFYRFAYSLPLDGNGMVATVAFNRADYELGKEFEVLNITGVAENSTLGFRYPIKRKRDQNVYLNLSIDDKYSRSTLGGETTSDKRIAVKSIGLSGDITENWLGSSGVTRWAVTAFSGDVSLRAKAYEIDGQTEQEIDASGAKVSGSFSKFAYSFNRTQSISQKTFLQFNLSAQVPSGSKNLDGSEKLALGGPIGVRAYPAGEGAGDQAYVYQLELRSMLVPNLNNMGNLSGIVFYDYGRTKVFNSPFNSSSINNYSLEGWGLGLILARSGKHELRLYGTKPIGSNPRASLDRKDSDGIRTGTRFAASLTAFF